MLSDAELSSRMAGRIAGAGHPWGRLRLRAYMLWKRVAWQCAVGSSRLIKRLLDVVVAGLMLLLLSPLLLVTAWLVRQDGGPVFFRQVRVGHGGREFGMLKFRSMVVNAEAALKDLLAKNEKQDGVTFKMRNDPRITRVGRFIRRTSIDELPQLINVLRGEMSLVGPRPPLPREVALYSQQDRRRLLATPGLTCLWQVGERSGKLFEIGDRNQIGFPEQVALDVRYIESQSVLRDLTILLKTVPAVLLGKGGA
ncbi:MAG: Undecaprenyl-phosphate galactose phosphotransferase [Verrucomicrobiales bacterium]|nr:Undecaprenyl-phosphate galactose phosphotransferase [Verrucomicrobiales bacterium]